MTKKQRRRAAFKKARMKSDNAVKPRTKAFPKKRKKV